MTNVSNGDRRLWVHLVSIWVISLYLLKVGGSRCFKIEHEAQRASIMYPQ